MRSLLAILAVLGSSSAFATGWGGAAYEGDFEGSHNIYETANMVSCQELIDSLAQRNGLQVKSDYKQHKYENGHICTKIVAKYSNGKSCECYSPGNTNCQ